MDLIKIIIETLKGEYFKTYPKHKYKEPQDYKFHERILVTATGYSPTDLKILIENELSEYLEFDGGLFDGYKPKPEFYIQFLKLLM